MFQFDYFSEVQTDKNLSVRSRQRDIFVGAQQVKEKVVLSWAEHCIECAAPACYSTCDLYVPTQSGKCRRFENGIVAQPVDSGVGARAAKIEFKRWGKLEAQGNARLISSGTAHILESSITRTAPWIERAGRVIGRLTGDQRWLDVMGTLHKKLNDFLFKRANAANVPDSFVVNIHNPMSEPCELLFTCMVDKLRLKRQLRSEQLPHPVSHRLTLMPGDNIETVNVDGLRDILTSGLPFNLSLAPIGRETATLVFRQIDLVRSNEIQIAPSKSASEKGVGKSPNDQPAKLVIFDLDHTLWEGILLEGDVSLQPKLAELLDTLDQRGILLSIASKNAPEDAIAALEKFGIAEYFLFPQIGWHPKSQSVEQIVKAIDIGIDTVLFVDDNPFERSEVAGQFPAIEVLPETSIPDLAAHPRLQGSITEESKARRSMYKSSIMRTEATGAFGSNYLEFLRSCELLVTIRPPLEKDFERICELVQRTNQLNFSGRKYDRAAIMNLLQDDRQHHVVECEDKFGAYGTVGFCISHFSDGDGGSQLIIDDLMLSCRVQGKFVEQALLHYLTSQKRGQVETILVNFHKTERNRAAQLVLEDIGFKEGAQTGYSINMKEADLACDFLNVRSR